MTNREYTALVDKGQYPEDPTVPVGDLFISDAGAIQNLLLERCNSVAYILSVAGSERANHYHKTDWHYAYVLKGAVWYFWRPVGSGTVPNLKVFREGEMLFTPPMLEHAFYFPETAAFMTFAKNVRDHEHHEADVVRVAPLRKVYVLPKP